MSLLFKLTYGLYLLSAKDENNQNGCIINTVMQQTSTPERISVTVNKSNLTCDMIAKTGKCVINILNCDTSFDFIKNFGMQSGRTANKFINIPTTTSTNQILTNLNNSLGYFELKVVETINMGTHNMFVCEITESVLQGSGIPLTYAYYQSDIKPKPAPKVENEEVWVCRICNYVHKGTVPANFICPICKHGADDLVKQ